MLLLSKLLSDKGSTVSTQKEKALQMAISQIEKEFGAGTVMTLNNSIEDIKTSSIPTGSISLDLALGIGGIPRGRVTELFGTESSGKTTLAYHIMASAQKNGGVSAYIDAEHALDPEYAAKCGLLTDDLLVSQPDSAEQALEIAEYLVRSGAVDIIVIDSVAALVPKAELEGDMGDSHVGLQARIMSQALRKLTAAINKFNSTIIFINQIREKVGVIWGSPEVTPGGRALKFFSSVRIDLRRIESIKVGTDITGSRVRAKIVKNKVAAPFKVAEFDIMYGEGISLEGDLLDIAVEHKIIEKSGAWFSYSGERLGQGRENVKTLFKDKPELSAKIEQQVRKALGLLPESKMPANDRVQT